MTASTIRTAAHTPRFVWLTLLVLCSVPLIAAADDPAYPPIGAYPVTRVVKYDDLDLNSAAGTRKLYRRLEAAVRTVCDAKRSYPPDYIKTTIRPCVTTALHNAVKDVNAPLLTAYHQKRIGIPQGTTVAAQQ